MISIGAVAALTPLGAARASFAVQDGAAFRIGEEECRFIDLIAPRLQEPHGARSAAILNEILTRWPPKIEDAGDPDRWNRRVVRASAMDSGRGRSVEALLVATGAVRVRPESADHHSIRMLLTLESRARRAGRGLWRTRVYAVRAADDANGAVGGFHLVEGVVASASLRKGRAYVNFGDDYRTDFTATAASRDARRWAKEGLDLTSLAGARVRIRGYASWINGPSIDVTHPLQIENLSAHPDTE